MSWPTTLWEYAESVRAMHALPAVIDPTATRSPRLTARWWAMSTLCWRPDGSSLADPQTGPA